MLLKNEIGTRRSVAVVNSLGRGRPAIRQTT